MRLTRGEAILGGEKAEGVEGIDGVGQGCVRSDNSYSLHCLRIELYECNTCGGGVGLLLVQRA